MRLGHTLLAGLGWAEVLGGVALCVLISLSVSLAFDDDPSGVRDRPDRVLKLLRLPDARLPAVPLARPRRDLAVARRRSTAIGVVAPGRGAGDGNPPAGGHSSPAPAPLTPSGAGGGGGGGGEGGAPPQSPVGETARAVSRVIGTEVGDVSPPVGRLIVEAGDAAADAIASIGPPSLPAP